MATIEGRATVAGTQRFRDRAINERHLAPEHFRIGPEDLAFSSLGLGTYIGRPDAPTDLVVEQSVSVALTSGRINVLDTAINYRYQRAERSVGRSLARLFDRGTIDRAEVFVATKNGYLAPDAESTVPVGEWVERELVRPGILDPADIVDGSHAMSPPYLRDQFERSRRNLGLSSVDLLYLHNAADAQLPVVGADEFTRRLSEAFTLYEQFRDAGRIGCYGLATWDCLRVPRGDPGYLSLEAVVRLAREVGGEGHGFRFVQFPFNVAMPEAFVVQNQPVDGERWNLFEAGRRLRIGCFTSVPLYQGQLAKSGPRREGLSAAQTAIQFARSAPGSLAPLIGQKRPEHLSENLALAERPPWELAEFRSLVA